MTDIRQALEEAFRTIYGAPDRSNGFDYWKPELVDKRLRFNQLIQAEAWTDAAMCLVPDGCGVDMLTGSNELPQFIAHSAMPTMARVFFLSKGIDVSEVAETPAHALLAACLKAKEQADG